MKVSVYKVPGFKQGHGYRVMMDGRQLERVFQADSCTGVAWIADTDADGMVRIDRNKQEVMVRKVYGPIRLEKMD